MTAESCLFAPFCRPSSQHTGPDKEWTCKSLLNMFRTTNTSFQWKNLHMGVIFFFFFFPHHTAPWPWIDPGPSPVKAPVLTTGPSQEIPSMYVNIILAIRRVIKHDAKHAGRSQIVKDQVKYTKKPSVEFWKGEWDDNIGSFKQPSGDNMEHRTAGKEKVRDGKAPLQVAAVRIGRRDGYKDSLGVRINDLVME